MQAFYDILFNILCRHQIRKPFNFDKFLFLTPFTGYELGLGDGTYNFIIRKTNIPNTTNLIIGNEKLVFAKIFPYGYNILPSVSYFNINNITIEENNLLKLDTSGLLIGKLNFLSS